MIVKKITDFPRKTQLFKTFNVIEEQKSSKKGKNFPIKFIVLILLKKANNDLFSGWLRRSVQKLILDFFLNYQ